jgi:hypothetical protein
MPHTLNPMKFFLHPGVYEEGLAAKSMPAVADRNALEAPQKFLFRSVPPGDLMPTDDADC